MHVSPAPLCYRAEQARQTFFSNVLEALWTAPIGLEIAHRFARLRCHDTGKGANRHSRAEKTDGAIAHRGVRACGVEGIHFAIVAAIDRYPPGPRVIGRITAIEAELG